MLVSLEIARLNDGIRIGDIEMYVSWTRLVTFGGIQSAYSGTFPESYANYPPVILYSYELVGNLYRWLVDPSFDLNGPRTSDWIRHSIRGVALVWHLLVAAAVFLLLRQRGFEQRAGIAAALYVISPAALFDAAHWAQPDGAPALFSVLVVGWFGLGFVVPA